MTFDSVPAGGIVVKHERAACNPRHRGAIVRRWSARFLKRVTEAAWSTAAR